MSNLPQTPLRNRKVRHTILQAAVLIFLAMQVGVSIGAAIRPELTMLVGVVAAFLALVEFFLSQDAQ